MLRHTVDTLLAPGSATVEIHPEAVFNEARKMQLHLATENCGSHSFFAIGTIKRSDTVEVQCIDARCLPRADVLKLDVEGSELYILLALREIGRLREFSAIMLEYHSDILGLAARELLSKAGFTLTGEKLHEKHRGELRYVRTDCLRPPEPGTATVVLPLEKKRSLYIATPAHDHKFHAGYTFSLLKLVNCGQFKLSFNRAAGCGVAWARNNMAAEFITDHSAEFYCSIDSDITFEPHHLARCIAFDKPIVCVPYALKQDSLQWCMNEIPGEVPDPAHGFQKVATAGTGFMIIKREVFQHMIRAFPEIAYKDNLAQNRGHTRWDLFPMGVNKGLYLTEDWFFCVKARELGYDIWLDATTHVWHEGAIAYPIEKQRKDMYLTSARPKPS
jgi:FkbM family methyltransferase